MTCYSVPPPNEKSRIVKRIMIGMLIWEILLGTAKGIFLSRLELVFELVALGVLWVSFNSLNYCNCVFYIIICMFNSVFILMQLATKIQDGVVLTDFSDPEQKIFILISSTSFVFYIVSIYFAFQGYKEFKGIAYDILVATHNHELSLISQYNSPAKRRPSYSNSQLKFDLQDSFQNLNHNNAPTNADFKQYKKN